MRAALPLLTKELELVNPRYVVTFGLLPLEVLTGAPHRLRDILDMVKKGTYAPIRSVSFDGKRYHVLPCYYPLGHGNPPKARKILRYIHTRF